jgi:hypothetical protein
MESNIKIYHATIGKYYQLIQRRGKPTDIILGEFVRKECRPREDGYPSAPRYVFKKDGVETYEEDEYPAQLLICVSFPEKQ